MKTLNTKKTTAALMAAFMLTAAGCSAKAAETAQQSKKAAVTETAKEETQETEVQETPKTEVQNISQSNVVATAAVTSDGLLDATDFFTDRDLSQTADLSEAQYITLTSGQDVNITGEGVYVLSGNVSDVTVRIEADDTAKVQIVLNGVTITNTDAPAIYV
ncbi:MAG: carbohydrate-binding domain-containing protein, partial [Erysipelotrichaceae bacterium]|nr:carbohydrate-binding domain-containing protein [Erysipelotrichaceae bacterium]